MIVPAARGELDGVPEEVSEDLEQTLKVRGDLGQLLFAIHAQPDPELGAGGHVSIDRLGEDLDRPHGRWIDRRASRTRWRSRRAGRESAVSIRSETRSIVSMGRRGLRSPMTSATLEDARIVFR